MQKPPSNLISSYKKRQQIGPFVIWGAAALLVLFGIVLLALWLTGPDSPATTLFASETPTPTLTFTPTNTSTPTLTPTETPTATVTLTPTASQPFEYVVQQGDYLFSIVEKFQLGEDGLMLILLLNPRVPEDQITDATRPGIDPKTMNIFPGQKLTIPNPGMPLPSATPIPLAELSRGAKIEYVVQPGETLEFIASKFLSTVEDILKENNITDRNAIQAYQILVIRVNLVTPTNTSAPTITPGSVTPTPIPFLSTPTVSPTP
jgi:LysM repeat protein